MNKTTIDWPHLTHTWNPIVGCTHGCDYCYARKLHNKRHKAYLEGKKLPKQYAVPFDTLQFFPERLEEPIKHKTPATIFVGSMCDIFDRNVFGQWIYEIIKVMGKCPQHTFMLLTKRPHRYKIYVWPDNCILGITLESFTPEKYSRMFDSLVLKGRRFLSIEPIQGNFLDADLSPFELVIVGADSTPGAPAPEREWINSIQHHNIHFKKNILKHFPDLKNKEE